MFIHEDLDDNMLTVEELIAVVKEAQQERLKVVKAANLKEQKAVEHLLKTI